MSSQNMQNRSKPNSKPQNSQGSPSADYQGSEGRRTGSKNLPQTEKMETFPKTNTFPKNWDLSSFSKE